VARILGYASPEELVRERHDIAQQGYVDPRARDEFKRRIDADGAVNGFEYEAWRKDGSKVWVSENARVVRDPAGRVLHYEGAMEDITGRKQAQAALRESEEQLRAMFDLASVGSPRPSRKPVGGCGSIGRCARSPDIPPRNCSGCASPKSLIRMTGSPTRKPSSESCGASSPTTHGKALPPQRWLPRVGEREHDDYPRRRGQPLRSVAMIEDITERKAAEKALRESQALHRSLVTHIPAGVFRKIAKGVRLRQ